MPSFEYAAANGMQYGNGGAGSAFNADGSLKSTYEVLTELAPQWEAMSDAQRVALGDSIAG